MLSVPSVPCYSLIPHNPLLLALTITIAAMLGCVVVLRVVVEDGRESRIRPGRGAAMPTARCQRQLRYACGAADVGSSRRQWVGKRNGSE